MDEKIIPAVEDWLIAVVRIVSEEKCPPVINAKICKSCSYYDLCYINEE